MSQTQVAAAVVVIKNSEILMLKRKGSEGDGTWAIPGGKVDFMEDPADAVLRELTEETGIKGSSVEFIGYTNDIHKESNKHFVTMRFICKDFSGEPRVAEPNKCSKISWFSLDTLPSPLFGPTMNLLTDKTVLQKIQTAMS
jgi:8-oxo-dGTP diphosphatase